MTKLRDLPASIIKKGENCPEYHNRLRLKKSVIQKLISQKTALFIFLFNEEKETFDWIDEMVGQWWDFG